MVEDGFGEDIGLFTLKEKVAELLAPYSDDIVVKPYIERTRDDIIAGIGDNARAHYGDAICDKAIQGDTAAIRKVAKDWFGYQLVDDNGNAYSTLSPNAHWDYWRIEHNDKQDDWLNGLGMPTFRSDSIPDAELIDRMVGNVITPDGTWHCQDEDGSFVPSEVIGRYPDCTCVTVDLHI